MLGTFAGTGSVSDAIISLSTERSSGTATLREPRCVLLFAALRSFRFGGLVGQKRDRRSRGKLLSSRKSDDIPAFNREILKLSSMVKNGVEHAASSQSLGGARGLSACSWNWTQLRSAAAVLHPVGRLLQRAVEILIRTLRYKELAEHLPVHRECNRQL